ncbi:5793_t:CDS:2 [Acaulospora morrowiae]|uniref:5793_t:CDS:1 n=1 Tax=Acaulospora morrowiae TaxID=94023 RepID=A0A9N9G671_9GLOM|nr:5793_t:CDS:2 [Acaulospora morrowiae]
MKHLAAYLLLSLAGKTPDAKSITSLLETVGIEADPDRIKTLLSELSDKDLNEIISEGSSKLSSVPSGGGAVSSGGAAGATGGSAPAEEAKKEEAKEEEKEESDEDMGFGLFD